MKIIIVLLIAALTLIGCSKDEPEPEPTASDSTSASTGVPTDIPSIEPDPPLTTASEPAVTGPDWPTSDVSAQYDTAIPSMPVLNAIRHGTHENYDRIALEFNNLPNYEIGYESSIVYDGSGEPVSLNGDAFLQLVFNPAQAHTDAGEPTLPSPLLNQVSTGFPALQAYLMNGDYEGYVSIALGLSDKLGFDVQKFQTSEGNWVIYVDIAHP